jgi:hypothetical protein
VPPTTRAADVMRITRRTRSSDLRLCHVPPWLRRLGWVPVPNGFCGPTSLRTRASWETSHLLTLWMSRCHLPHQKPNPNPEAMAPHQAPPQAQRRSRWYPGRMIRRHQLWQRYTTDSRTGCGCEGLGREGQCREGRCREERCRSGRSRQGSTPLIPSTLSPLWLTQQGSLTLQSTPLVEPLNIEADATERYSGRAAMLSPAVIAASVNSMRFTLPAPFAAILAAGKTITSSRRPTAAVAGEAGIASDRSKGSQGVHRRARQ